MWLWFPPGDRAGAPAGLSLIHIWLTQGAAAIAYYKYALLEAAVGCHSLKAGELSVSCDGDGLLRAAGAIRDDAILSLADLADFSPKVLFEVKP